MLEEIYRSEPFIKKLRDGVLGQYVDPFATFLVRHGYLQRTLRCRLAVVCDLGNWLDDQGLCLSEFNEQRVGRFIEYREERSGGRANYIRRGDGKTLSLLVDWLRSMQVIPKPLPLLPENKSIEDLILDYAQYLNAERGFTTTTVKRYSDVARQFLITQLKGDDFSPQKLNQNLVLTYICRCRKRFSPKHTQLISSVLRSFLIYQVVQGGISTELATCIPSTPSWRASHLPEFLSPSQVKRLLDSCDRCTPKGLRNYAILLLLIRLGLRASEALNLSLDDINWEQGEIEIHGKQRKRRLLPLPNDVGDALASYLQSARPSCDSRQIFIRTRAPYRGLQNPSNISSIVHRALLAAGLDPQHHGAHLLRYTAATTSLRNGATLFEIGDLLGHSSVDTTALYIKVDIERLKQLSVPWPTTKAGDVR